MKMVKTAFYRIILCLSLFTAAVFAFLYYKGESRFAAEEARRSSDALYALSELLEEICAGAAEGADENMRHAGETAAAQAEVWLTQTDLSNDDISALVKFIRAHEHITESDIEVAHAEEMIRILDRCDISSFAALVREEKSAEPISIRENGSELRGLAPSSSSAARKAVSTAFGTSISMKKAKCDLVPPSYIIYCDNVYARISMNGGHILSLAYDCDFDKAYTDVEACRKAADSFIEKTLPKSKRKWLDVSESCSDGICCFVYKDSRGRTALAAVSRYCAKVIYYNGEDLYK